MTPARLGIIMNGVTGRMGTNQHLIRSICAIRNQGGVKLSDGSHGMPDPILVGRNPDKLAALAKSNNVDRWTTDLDAALANKDDLIYFDAGMTNLRAASIKKSHRGKKNTSTAKNPPPLRSRKPSRCFGSPTKQACSATPTLPSPE